MILNIPREEVVPSFWRYFEDTTSSSPSAEAAESPDSDSKAATVGGGDDFEQFERAVSYLHASLAAFMPGLQDLARLVEKKIVHLSSSHSLSPLSFSLVLYF
jgi:hypothetical protein